jgi:hypothetical protein
VIIVPEGQELRVITQPDHARFSAQLLELWTTGGLPDHPSRADLLFAVREHDNGWREADSAPLVDRVTSAPHDFLSYPEDQRLEVWKRGVDRYADTKSYSSLLILEHARVLHSASDELWTAYLGELDVMRQDLLEQLELDEDQLKADYTYLRLTDKLSLTICNKWQNTLRYAGFESQAGDDWMTLNPFPMVGTTTFRIPCRFIPNRPYSNDSDLGGALAESRWQELEIQVKPSFDETI